MLGCSAKTSVFPQFQRAIADRANHHKSVHAASAIASRCEYSGISSDPSSLNCVVAAGKTPLHFPYFLVFHFAKNDKRYKVLARSLIKFVTHIKRNAHNFIIQALLFMNHIPSRARSRKTDQQGVLALTKEIKKSRGRTISLFLYQSETTSQLPHKPLPTPLLYHHRLT